MLEGKQGETRQSVSPQGMAEALGFPAHSFTGRLDFQKSGRYIFRRLFAELFGTFLLVVVAAGGSVVNARFGGHAIPTAAQVVAPGLMVASIILFMGAVSGAHLNPVVTIAFALREDFAWKRVPGYIAAQLAGSALAMELLVLLLGRQGTAGLTLPGAGVSPALVMAWEMILTLGLVSVILGTASGAQNVGWGAAIGVGGYIALAGSLRFPSERRLHEPCPLAWTDNDPRRLLLLVGLCGRTTDGRCSCGGCRLAAQGQGGRHLRQACRIRNFG